MNDSMNSALETIGAVAEALVPAPSAVTGVAPELDAVVLRAFMETATIALRTSSETPQPVTAS